MKAILERKLDFLGYSNYFVDSEGCVWSLNYNKTGKIKRLSCGLSGSGYYIVALYNENGRKLFRVNVLICMAFHQNEWFEGAEVSHKNGTPTDNRSSNLEWDTHKGNCNNEITRHRNRICRLGNKSQWYGMNGKNHPRSKPILQYTLEGEFVREWESINQVERELGFSNQNISRCCCGKRKTAYDFIWKHKEGIGL